MRRWIKRAMWRSKGAPLALCLSLAACDAESEIAPQTPNDVRDFPHGTAPAPDVDDSLVAQTTYDVGMYGTPRPRSPYTIDLGYIGDWQFPDQGESASPPGPSWARPFPCNWTRSCWARPVEPYYPPYARYYGR